MKRRRVCVGVSVSLICPSCGPTDQHFSLDFSPPAPSPGPNLRQFHALFFFLWKILWNFMLVAPPGGLAPYIHRILDSPMNGPWPPQLQVLKDGCVDLMFTAPLPTAPPPSRPAAPTFQFLEPLLTFFLLRWLDGVTPRKARQNLAEMFPFPWFDGPLVFQLYTESNVLVESFRLFLLHATLVFVQFI